MRLSSIRTLVLGLALAGCASGGAAGSTAGGSGQPHMSANVISAAELTRDKSPNVYQAIQHLRPQYLQPHMASQNASIAANRCTSMGTDPINGGPECTTHSGDYVLQVYMDDTKLGEVSVLKTISTSNVKEIRYFDPEHAQQKFGMGNAGGVIQLISN